MTTTHPIPAPLGPRSGSAAAVRPLPRHSPAGLQPNAARSATTPPHREPPTWDELLGQR